MNKNRNKILYMFIGTCTRMVIKLWYIISISMVRYLHYGLRNPWWNNCKKKFEIKNVR